MAAELAGIERPRALGRIRGERADLRQRLPKLLARELCQKRRLWVSRLRQVQRRGARGRSRSGKKRVDAGSGRGEAERDSVSWRGEERQRPKGCPGGLEQTCPGFWRGVERRGSSGAMGDDGAQPEAGRCEAKQCQHAWRQEWRPSEMMLRGWDSKSGPSCVDRAGGGLGWLQGEPLSALGPVRWRACAGWCGAGSPSSRCLSSVRNGRVICPLCKLECWGGDERGDIYRKKTGFFGVILSTAVGRPRTYPDGVGALQLGSCHPFSLLHPSHTSLPCSSRCIFLCHALRW